MRLDHLRSFVVAYMQKKHGFTPTTTGSPWFESPNGTWIRTFDKRQRDGTIARLTVLLSTDGTFEVLSPIETSMIKPVQDDV